MTSKNSKHKAAMQKQKAAVDASVEAASEERGIAVLLTGDGKGKTSSAFGMVMRARGYNQRIAVIQFIKGEMLSGEEIYIRDKCPDVIFIQMGTGFTWNTQDRTSDIEAAERLAAFSDFVFKLKQRRSPNRNLLNRMEHGVQNSNHRHDT